MSAEMERYIHGNSSFKELSLKSPKGISFWSWSELLFALEQCQNLVISEHSSLFLPKILDGVLDRLAISGFACHCRISLDKFSFHSSRDTRSSTVGTSNSCIHWFDNFLFLNTDNLHKMVKMMVCRELDNYTIRKFLISYQKVRFLGARASEKRNIIETVIEMLCLLDGTALSCDCLFRILRIARRLRAAKYLLNKLVRMIGSRIDHATVDHLLVQPPRDKSYHAYDVELVKRLVQSFLVEEIHHLPLTKLQKVGTLIDSYLIEIAPDRHLRPLDFASLISILPDCARRCHDELYHAIDLYLKTRKGLVEEDKIRICLTLKYEKLSMGALRHLAHNASFPRRKAIQDFPNKKSKFRMQSKQKSGEKAPSVKMTVYENKLFRSKEMSRSELKIQTEFENLCMARQTHAEVVPKKTFYLPKLCS